jgi:pimeloyl-ACP methyl ester carboxylesterase
VIRERTVTAGDRAVRYLEAGAGWPLVLLHAFPLASDMWRPQLERVPDGWRLLAPDLPGFGPDPGAPAGTMADMARAVVRWLDAMRIDTATIGGASMGGYVTMALLREAPERATAIVLANTRATADSEAARAGRDRMAAMVRDEGPRAVADQMLPTLLGTTSHAARPDVVSAVRTLIERNAADGIRAAVLAMKERPDSADVLARFNKPALIVTGEEDAIVPEEEATAMRERLPRSQQVRIPRAGHLANLENPDDFSEALENFLRANL